MAGDVHDVSTGAMMRPVAIIDDDLAYIRAVERMLRVAGIEALPITTPDAEEAARVVAEARCSAVLIDLMMYDEPQGLACIERLRRIATTAHTPLIVASGQGRQLRRISGFLVAHRCVRLDKPFGCDELLATISSLLSLPGSSPSADARRAEYQLKRFAAGQAPWLCDGSS